MKILFFGNSKISISALKSIINDDKFKIKLLVTNEDKFVGRNKKEKKENVVATWGKKNNINVLKSNNINKDFDKIKKLNVDYIVTCSFGQYLSNEILKLPKKYSLNIHTSLLPKGRGGAPIHWAIINGEKVTGITIIEMVDKMDAGDYFSIKKIDISNNETYDSLYEKLSVLIEKTFYIELNKINNNELQKKKQDELKATKWLNITKEDSYINFNDTSLNIYNRIRGCYSKPISWSKINDVNIKITSAKIIEKNINNYSNSKIGEIVKLNKDGILIKTKNNLILVDEVIIPGKKKNKIKNLINGNLPFKENDFFKIK